MPLLLDLKSMISARLLKAPDEIHGGFLWQCSECGHSSRSKSDVAKHVEAKHVVTAGYDCSFCGYHYPSKNALKSHISRKHRS
jgi:rubredoxin